MLTIMYRFISAAIVIILSTSLVDGQDKCPNLQIGVYVDHIFFGDTTTNYLNEKHGKDFSQGRWINELESNILTELNSAGYRDLEFFLAKSNPNADMDLQFRFSIGPWTVDKDEIIPPYEVKFTDPVTGWEVTEYRAPVWSQQIAFRMTSALVVCSPCVPSMSYIISMQNAVEVNVYQLIKNLIHHYNWPLDQTIDKWETKHPAPAREPQMEIRYQKEFLSVLDEESRKTEVYIKVKNCHGQYVYDKFNGQPVYFLKEMERLEYKDDPGDRCQLGPDWGVFSTVFTSEDLGAIGQYKVKKGIEPTIEKPRFKTCGIGNHSLIEVEGEIKVLGLELQVEPERNKIHNGEQTSIQIDLHEKDPDGNEYLSCSGKEVEVKVTGLVDGTISHKSGKMILNEVGVAFIDYKAGQKDKQIRISATFTPPGYPEEVKGEATINVKPLDYEATLTIRGRSTNTQNSSFTNKHSDGIEKGNFSLSERSEASFYVPLKLENSGDMPMFNQRWEYYRPLDINLSSFNASYRLKDYGYASHGNFGFEKTRTINKNPVNRKIPEKDYLLQSNIILIIDKETNKVVKIVTGGFPVEFQWDEIEKTTGRSWNPDGSEPIENFSHKTDEMSTQFTPGPVEDLIPDPTMKSVSESLRTYLKNLGTPLPADVEIPEDTEDKAEIPPDLLVEFGDGKTYFGGDGKKVIDKSKGSNIDRVEHTFFWQVTRKKKSL